MEKNAMKVAGLALVTALALAALPASMAQASLEVIDEPEGTITGRFLSGGTERPTGLTKEAIAAKDSFGSRLLIPGNGAEIDCGASKTSSTSIANEYTNFNSPLMKTKKGGHGVGTVTSENCKVFSVNMEGVKGAELSACTKVLNGEKTHNITAKWLLRAAQHEGATYLVIEPEITSEKGALENRILTSIFTTLTFGGTCSLPTPVNLTGAIVIKAPAADANKPTLSIKTYEVKEGKAVNSAEQVLLGSKLKFGSREAFIEDSLATAELTGAGAALSWGAM